jgi:hypothetical protein
VRPALLNILGKEEECKRRQTVDLTFVVKSFLGISFFAPLPSPPLLLPNVSCIMVDVMEIEDQSVRTNKRKDVGQDDDEDCIPLAKRRNVFKSLVRKPVHFANVLNAQYRHVADHSLTAEQNAAKTIHCLNLVSFLMKLHEESGDNTYSPKLVYEYAIEKLVGILVPTQGPFSVGSWGVPIHVLEVAKGHARRNLSLLLEKSPFMFNYMTHRVDPDDLAIIMPSLDVSPATFARLEVHGRTPEDARTSMPGLAAFISAGIVQTFLDEDDVTARCPRELIVSIFEFAV